LAQKNRAILNEIDTIHLGTAEFLGKIAVLAEWGFFKK